MIQLGLNISQMGWFVQPPKNSVFRFSTYGNSSEKFRKETPSVHLQVFRLQIDREKKSIADSQIAGPNVPPNWDDLSAFSSKKWVVCGERAVFLPTSGLVDLKVWVLKDGSGSFGSL